MAQLKLSLPEADVKEIRRRAHDAGRSPSVFLRELALGAREPALPEDRLAAVEGRQASAGARADEAQELAAQALEAVEGLERRLSRLEDVAGL